MRTFLLLWVAVGGCDDSTGSNNVSTVDDYQREAIRALCGYFARCGQISPSQESACKSAYTAQLGTSMPYTTNEAIASGRVSYDGTAASNCLAVLDSSNCDVFTLLDALSGAACMSIVRGLVPAGGSCKADNECSNGWCDRGGIIISGCPGTCKAFSATGGPCGNNNGRCASTDTCRNQVCITPGALNAACTATAECVRGLGCVANTCQGPAGEGADCTGRPCATGLYCNTTTQPPLCAQRQDAGGTCNGSTSCRPGLKCVLPIASNMGTCRAVVDVGQSCAAAACAEDSECDTTTQTCTLTGQLGDDCTSNDCSLNFYCNAAKKCAAPLSYGAACDPNVTASLQCGAGQCSATTMTCTLICS